MRKPVCCAYHLCDTRPTCLWLRLISVFQNACVEQLRRNLRTWWLGQTVELRQQQHHCVVGWASPTVFPEQERPSDLCNWIHCGRQTAEVLALFLFLVFSNKFIELFLSEIKKSFWNAFQKNLINLSSILVINSSDTQRGLQPSREFTQQGDDSYLLDMQSWMPDHAISSPSSI